MMREIVSSILEVVGLVLVVAGVAQWSPAAAMTVAGVGFVAVGYTLGASR